MMKFALSLVSLALLIAIGVHGTVVEGNVVLTDVAKQNASARISGGSNAPAGAFPHQVALRRAADRSYFCGGSIIAARWVLTTAHCVQGLQVSDIMITAGTTNWNRGGETYGVERIVVQPNYNPSRNRQSDLALLRTTCDIAFGTRVQAIPLAKNWPSVGTHVTAVGWGYTVSPSASFPNELQQVELKVVDEDKCRTFWPTYRNDFVCTQGRELKGICTGDDGGSLVCDNQLVGVLSWGNACALDAPDLSTSVAEYYPWIQSVTCCA